MRNKFLFLTPFLFHAIFSFGQSKENFIFATMETENAIFLQKNHADSIDLISSKDNLSAIYFHPAIAESLHGKFAHGHGYVFQNSKEDALQSLQEKPSQKKAPFNYTISEQAFITTALNDVDVKEIEKTILMLEGFKTRYHTRQEANDAVLKLKEVWEKMIADAGRTDVAVRIVGHVNTPMKSLILTFNGIEKKDEFVIIGGHADSTVGWNANQTFAPGADDNASGIATITEVLRVLLKNNFKPQRTTEIMAYAAEEIGLVGSKEIAQKYASENKNVIGYVQFDMTNYKGSTKDVILMTDTYCDANLNSFLMKLMDEYNKTGLHQFTYDTSKCGYGCSDHASWSENGYAVTLPFESKMGEDNPNIHTTGDTYAFMGSTSTHAAKFTKLGIEYVVEAAKTSTLGTNDIDKNSSKIYISNKILNYQLNFKSPISIKIIDASGRMIKTINTENSNGSVNLSNLSTGFYIATFQDDNGNSVSHKFVFK
ncbi:M20/M25/M40 family metallo-hydrolase [Empedobacter sp. GD03797]|uniref:M20/M25/M40 family metallo-hydrolase n=1 Tax=Empedobacter sp. GD03797 TaxID=2975382 RepID=UPI002447A09D|nr:M20/M25/M40 family metallo-hydrolase [Empedobacter sp. GD03797]MDH1883495.1 M20/M25/M40 family metallo-hydrolase [Empedobacter sp. GD03797]